MNGTSSWFKENLLPKIRWLMIFAQHRECLNLHNYTCINYTPTGSQSGVHSEVSLRERCHTWWETVYESTNTKDRNKVPDHLSILQEILHTMTPLASMSTTYLVKYMKYQVVPPIDSKLFFLGFKHCFLVVLTTLPAATMTMSASWVWILSCSFGVCLCAMVTVASPET